MIKTAQHQLVSSMNTQAKTGLKTVAVKAAKDEIFKPNAMTSQTKVHIKATGQDKANNTPTAVATPLPPLKPKNTGHM